MIVKEADNLCVCCGNIIPEGMQVCPMCGTKDDVESYAKLIRTDIQDEPLAKAALETALKIKDECEQAFRQGYDSGYDTAIKWYEDYIVKTENEYCELKQENERLKRENAMLKSQIEAYNSDSEEETE